MHKHFLFACTLIAFLGLTATTWAQDDETLNAQEDASADEATGKGTGTEGPGEHEFESRFRWGITGGLGALVGDYSGFGGGVAARFGMQIDPMFAAYAQPTLLFAVGAAADVDGADATAAGLYGIGALADMTLGDLFYLAAGPELLFGGFGSASTNVTANGASASAEASTGPFFGISTRLGFIFGTKRPDRRSGFSIGLDTHIVFAGDSALILPLLFLGYETA